ncbi:alanine/glycine:cation symporter family protein [Buchananella hordeovulneris]|uniref:alanine/glycine:cation symporter family protein n=1 Tax=Buchananella hordeovulneris TaxID=52770 RepID=UPI000F5FAC8B|nr:alanine/glycine:cation symporter family protein [Buchananella hordeovulneris]RRD43004.1 alanine:cation symporter family protein [Buchananella hordeovulneris]RRD51677.1 alanine:cation symporter family protein [Buchananella hordeovulneris]
MSYSRAGQLRGVASRAGAATQPPYGEGSPDLQDILNTVLEQIANYLYTYVLIVILIGGGLYFFLRTRALPLVMLPEAVRLVREAPAEQGAVSSFKALMVSTASRVGIGNIAGVSTAIALGGAGAVFWMWVIALLGAASAFVESTLAQIYKRRAQDGTSYGGPAYYIATALRKPWLGYLFAVCLILTYVGGFNLVASYTMFESISTTKLFGPYSPLPFQPSVLAGFLLAAALGLAVYGGVKWLANVTAVLVPFMAISYLLLCFIVIGANVTSVLDVLIAIFRQAFDLSAFGGGFAGSAIMLGIKRGLYSNEAGVGSAPNAAATASVSHPAKQGLVQMLSVWIDTMVICTATALALLCSGVGGLGADGTVLKGAPYVQAVWQSVFGALGPHLVTAALLVFGFTTLLGNYFYAEANLRIVLRHQPSEVEKSVFRLLCCIVVYLGANAKFDVVWNAADIIMGVLVLINMPSILVLGRHALRALQDYRGQRRRGRNPVYVAADNGVTETTDYWR